MLIVDVLLQADISFFQQTIETEVNSATHESWIFRGGTLKKGAIPKLKHHSMCIFHKENKLLSPNLTLLFELCLLRH